MNKVNNDEFSAFGAEVKRIMTHGDDVLVTVTNTMRPIKPTNGEHYSLHELQHYVGGYIETIVLGNKVLIVDEEGKLKGKLPNRIATGWLLTSGIDDFVAGDAMLIMRERIQ